jgi:hypothetical protein
VAKTLSWALYIQRGKERVAKEQVKHVHQQLSIFTDPIFRASVEGEYGLPRKLFLEHQNLELLLKLLLEIPIRKLTFMQQRNIELNEGIL